MLLVQEVKTSISYLEEIFKVDISNIDDDKIKSRKDEIQNTCSSWITFHKRCRFYILECVNSVTEDQIEDTVGSIVTRNGKIVWKHKPNGPFYMLKLRSKLY